MKKKLSVLLAVLVVCSIVLFGCSNSKSSKSKLEGTTWKLTAASAEGMDISGDMLDSTFGKMTYEFKKGGKFSIDLNGEKADGTYSEKGNKVTIESEGTKIDAKLDGNKLTMDAEGVSMTFEKQ